MNVFQCFMVVVLTGKVFSGRFVEPFYLRGQASIRAVSSLWITTDTICICSYK